MSSDISPAHGLKEPMQERKTYIAILLRVSTSDAPEFKALYEESFLLIEAANEKSAAVKAQAYGTPEHKYVSAAGYNITTRLVEVVEVNEVLGIVDDDITEIHSRYFHDYEAYKKFRQPL